MAKFKKSILFKQGEKRHFLFRVINFGNDRCEIKFVFLDKDIPRGVINTNETNTIGNKDIITGYGEITYHSDGSLLKKFPTYPIKTMRYKNPKHPGFRRRPFDEIKDWEPLFKYDVYDYRVNEIPQNYFSSKHEVYELENNLIFNGNSFHVLINLAHVDFKGPESVSPYEINTRISNVTPTLDLWIVIAPSGKKGNYIKVEGMDQPVFSTNNHLQVVEKNA